MVRYYGWYSNKSRGVRIKQGIVRPGDQPIEKADDVEIIDVADYQPKPVPSKTWRDCIKKIYEVDPLCCPKCGGEMRIISFINEDEVIEKILDHLGLWSQKSSRDPPKENSSQTNNDLVYEPIDDGWPEYEEPYIVLN